MAGGTYKADTTHANVGFTISHMVISTVRGHFDEFDATVVLADDGTVERAEAVIQAASINTANEKRDNHLRAPDFFDAENYPEITFKSTGVGEEDGQKVLRGQFTMHGVTKDVAFPFTVKGPVQDPWGNTKIGFKLSGVIDRTDYGLTWSKVLETGGLVVGEEVTLDVELEFAKQ